MASTSKCRMLVLIFVCSILLKSGCCINLDARFSIIKKGKDNSYFGFSVAQHQIAEDTNKDSSISPDEVAENVLLVGAPYEKVTEGGHTFGGALYRCKSQDPAEDECKKITEGVYESPRSGYVVEDQWFGVSVASAGPGKKAVACAHRFITNNAALGICRVFVHTLDEQEIYFLPCDRQLHKNYMEDFGLCQAGMSTAMGQSCAHRFIKGNAALGACYTLFQNLKYDSPFMPCQRKPHKLYMKNFGLCQAGLAVAMGQEDSLVMGAPGSVFWQGTMFLTNVSDEYGVSQKEISSPFKDPKQVDGDEQPTPVKAYSYQGYSSDMGRFDRTKALYYVSGAPNSQSFGEVIFYQKISGKLRYDKNHKIGGKMAFSGFGSSLLVVDLNEDGFDDLIVGAPYYYKRNYGGAFYVYLGGSEMINSATEPTEVLSRQMVDEECTELGCEHARFGQSLGKLGDINMDGFQDFAVGAPYEGNGVVYIYHGQDSDAGFTTLYVQRILASELPVPDLTSFGYSLSGGMDLDGNGYPDLLVGAYESATVALIRARPIIKIYPSISVSPNLIDLEAPPKCTLPGVKEKYKKMHCVGVTLCLNFTTKPDNSLKVLPDVEYSIEAEKQRLISRIELQDAVDANKKLVEGKSVTLDPAASVCVTEIAIIKGSFEDKLNPISFTYSFGLSTDSSSFPSTYPESAQVEINNYPILDTESGSAEANTFPLEVDFVKECGEDNECFSNLQFTSQLLSPTGDLTKIGEDEFEMVIKAENELQLVLGVTNYGEPAYLTRIYVKKPELVSFQGIKSSSTVTCVDVKNNDTMIQCDHIGNPLRTGKSVYFNMILNIPREMAESEEMYAIASWVNTSSTESTPLNDMVEAKFKLINKAEIVLSTNVVPDSSIRCEGKERGANAMRDETEIGASVKHNFIVTNAGPGVISESYISIDWPYEVSGPKGGPGKYLLYLMSKPQVNGPVEDCNYDEIQEYINPLKIKRVASEETTASTEPSKEANLPVTVKDIETVENGTEYSSRTRRDAERQTSERGDVVVMNCRDKTANCFQFKCKLGKLEANKDLVRITMDSRLWESTLLSDYIDAAEVQMISWAQLTLPTKLKIQQDTSNDQRRAITRAVPDYQEASKKGLQWWIILVAVLAAIIVLLIVIFILHKLGCFRRKRPDDLMMYRAEKTTQDPMLKEYGDEDDA